MTPLETFATIVGITGGLIAILTAIFRPIIKKVKAMLDTWEDFMSDWKGAAADDGHDRVPGVMERLNELDGEFKRNGGATLKDAVARIEAKLELVDERLDKGNEKMESIDVRLKEGDDRMSRIEQSLEKGTD